MSEDTVLLLLLGLAFTFGATLVSIVAIVFGRSLKWKSGGNEIVVADDPNADGRDEPNLAEKCGSTEEY